MHSVVKSIIVKYKVAGSGLRISQSFDRGSNWDYHTDYAPLACSGSAYSIEIIGNAVKIEYHTDSAASQFRILAT